MSFSVIWTTQFKRDYKKASKRNLPIELLDDIIRKLAEGEKLPEKNRDHALSVNWLLIYRVEVDILVLTLARTGTHGDLF